MMWIKSNALWIGLSVFLAVAVGGITATTFILKRHADVIREAAKAPPPPPAVVAAPPAEPVAAPPTLDSSKRKQRVGPASSKDCAGLTVAKCAAKRKTACEKRSGGKACVASKGHW